MADTAPTFEDVTDAQPVTPTEARTPGLDQCIVCGEDLYYSGRGRHPKYCDEHKPTGTRQATPTADAPKAGGTTPALTRINAGITTQVMGLGNMIRMVEAFDGSVLVNQAEDVGRTCETIARRDPKFKKACEDWLSKTGYVELAVMFLGIFTPIAAHHGFMPPRLRPGAEWMAANEARQIDHATQLLAEYGMR